MARIINAQPGQGQVDDQITIDLEYDPIQGGGAPNVAHVVFYNNVDAPTFNVTHIDTANRRLTVVARVPHDAVTGPLEVDVAGAQPIRTVQSFTVTRPNANPVTVTSIQPAMGAGYQRGARMTIRLAGVGPKITGVYFPTSDYGPAVLQAQQTTYSQMPLSATIRVIPQQAADHGRVKIAMGPTAVYTRVLTFV
jgi:hypothetical protein